MDLAGIEIRKYGTATSESFRACTSVDKTRVDSSSFSTFMLPIKRRLGDTSKGQGVTEAQNRIGGYCHSSDAQ